MATSRIAALLVAAGLAVSCSACGAGVSVPVMPPTGILFTSQSAPLDTRFTATPVGGKQGEAIIHFIQDPILTGLPIITWGDADLGTALAEGGIAKAHYSDYELFSVLGIYVRLTVRVSGD